MIIMRKLLLAALAIAALSLQSCTFVRFRDDSRSTFMNQMISASDNLVTENFSIDDFDRVIVQVHGDVSVRQAEGESSGSVTIADNLYEYLQFNVEDGELTIKMDDNYRYRYSKMDISLVTSDLSSLTIQGAGDVDICGLVTDAFSVTIQGAGDVDVEDLECGHFEAVIQGAGDIEATGKASSADLTIQGAGDIDIIGLECDDVTSKVQGAGSIKRK